jgi:transposase
VLCVETIGKIRRRRLVDGESISGIARDLGLARNTVKKALRSGGEPFEYQRENQPQPKLGAFVARLDEWLEAEEKLPVRERRTAQRLYEALCLEGYTGAVDSVRRHLKRRRERTKPVEAFIPQSFAPGEAYQFDWSHEHVELGGESQVVKVAHVRLCYSRAFLLVAYPRESQEMVFDAHAKAFAYLGGIPRRGIYDNLKPAVDVVFIGKERRFNRRFLAMCSHYLIEPTACTPAAGWEKGQVENQVGNARRWLFVPKPSFADLATLNAWLRDRCDELARTRKHPEQVERTVAEVWADERSALQPVLPAFDGFHERVCRVTSTALVHFERNRYSVDCRYAGRTVALRAYADRIVIVVDGIAIGEHERRFTRYETIYNPWHYVPALEHKPGALRNGAPFKDWDLPGAMTRVREKLAKHTDGDRQFVEILTMVALYGLDAVADACAVALEQEVVASSHVVNLLHRAAQAPPAPILQVPEALRLTHEPIADCSRYDRLLSLPDYLHPPEPRGEELLCKLN